MKLVLCIPHKRKLWQVPGWFAPKLCDEFPGLEVVELSSYDELDEAIKDADVLMAWSIRKEQFVKAKRLKWIHCPAAAVHNLVIPEVVASDVVVTNSREVHGATVAEHVIALILSLAKRLHRARDFQGESQWGLDAMLAETPLGRVVKGETVAVIGMGEIGSNTARLAKCMGMRVLGVRARPALWDASVERMYGLDKLDDALREADFVVIAAPVTSQTNRMMNAARFSLMKPRAYLINVARGALVDTDALLAAIREKKIGGAALDVFDEEPLPPDSPIWKTREILVTPHSAGVNENLWNLHFELLSENLRRYKDGKPLRGMVEKEKGY